MFICLATSLSSLQLLPWTYSLVDFLSPLHLALILRFCLVLSYETCSSDTLFSLSCCLYFCMLVTSPNLGDVAFGSRHRICISNAICFHFALYALAFTPMRAACILLLWWANCGWSGRLGGPQVKLLSKPCLVQRLLGAGWQSLITWRLTGETQRFLGLALAKLWVESGSRRLWHWCPPTGMWIQILGLLLNYW